MEGKLTPHFFFSIIYSKSENVASMTTFFVTPQLVVNTFNPASYLSAAHISSNLVGTSDFRDLANLLKSDNLEKSFHRIIVINSFFQIRLFTLSATRMAIARAVNVGLA